MKKSKIRTLLNRLLWDPQYKEDKNHVIEYVHRVGRNSIIKRVKIKDIKEIRNWYLIISTSSGGTTLIPFHRITRIMSSDGKVLWSKTNTFNS